MREKERKRRREDEDSFVELVRTVYFACFLFIFICMNDERDVYNRSCKCCEGYSLKGTMHTAIPRKLLDRWLKANNIIEPHGNFERGELSREVHTRVAGSENEQITQRMPAPLLSLPSDPHEQVTK